MKALYKKFSGMTFLKRFLLLFILFLPFMLVPTYNVLFEGPYAPIERFSGKPIIDTHVHVAGLGYGSDSFVSESLRSSPKYKIFLRAFGVDEEMVKEKGDAIIGEIVAKRIKESRYISQAIILAMDGIIDPATGQLDRKKTELYVPNEFIHQLVQDHPKEFLFGASVNPHRSDAIERLRKVRAQGAVLIKWIPSIQLINPADPKLEPFYKEMADLGLILLSHTGNERTFTWAEDQWADPKRLQLPLSLGVTVIAAHVATTGKIEGQDNVERLQEIIVDYPNLWVDGSSLTQFNKIKYLPKILNHELIRSRMLYGSDYPLTNTPLVNPWLFWRRIRVGELVYFGRLTNSWDRDAMVKQHLGFPEKSFSQLQVLLNDLQRVSHAQVSALGHAH